MTFLDAVATYVPVAAGLVVVVCLLWLAWEVHVAPLDPWDHLDESVDADWRWPR